MNPTQDTWRKLVTDAATTGNTADLALLIQEAPSTTEAEWAHGYSTAAAPIPTRAAYLFAGVMVDRADSERERLPPAKVTAAGEAIEHAIDDLGALPGDRAVAGGACGGDLLFAAAVLRRGLTLDVLIPFDVTESLKRSVEFAGQEWVTRFYETIEHPKSTLHSLPEATGPTPEEADPFERVNRWLVHYARAKDPHQLNLIALWDGRAGRGPGGTQDLYDRAKDFATAVRVIDPTGL